MPSVEVTWFRRLCCECGSQGGKRSVRLDKALEPASLGRFCWWSAPLPRQRQQLFLSTIFAALALRRCRYSSAVAAIMERYGIAGADVAVDSGPVRQARYPAFSIKSPVAGISYGPWRWRFAPGAAGQDEF